MGFKCGIVGLPNVCKSTLFNALTASKNAEAANFPFCTIDPNIGIVDVPDVRLDSLAKLSKSKKHMQNYNSFDDFWREQLALARFRIETGSKPSTWFPPGALVEQRKELSQ